jgi:undecaprenyl-diphosphatase
MRSVLKRLMEWDNRFSSSLRLPDRAKGWLRAAGIIAHTGDSWYWLAGLAFAWLIGNPYCKYASALMAVGVFLQAAFVLGLKFIIRRRRPPGEWGAIYRSTDPHSFPSGHATRAGLLLVMSWGLLPQWLAMVITVWAPIMSLSRVMMGVHYLSDVLAGFLFGLLAGGIVLELLPLIISFAPFLFQG